jgi:hypothetical protein
MLQKFALFVFRAHRDLKFLFYSPLFPLRGAVRFGAAWRSSIMAAVSTADRRIVCTQLKARADSCAGDYKSLSL